MSSVHYIAGDATRPNTMGRAIIAHVCNDVGAWGAGFVLALSKRYPQAEWAYRQWHQEQEGRRLELGAVLFVEVAAGTWVANMVGQRGIRRTLAGPPVRYEAIATCLATVAEKAKALGASVHMPRIGAGLAGGKWDEIEPLIEEQLVRQGVAVYVYDLKAA